jgi:hypothetical protein
LRKSLTPFATARKHLRRDINSDHSAIVRRESRNERSCAGAHIETETAGYLGKVSNEPTLPETIDAEAQHPVQLIVGRSDLVEHVSHVTHRNWARKS